MMDKERLEQWKDGVMEHCKYVQDMIKQRKLLKEHIEEHLSQFFDWESIEYSKDFDVITLTWAYGHNPIIYHDKIGELNMDWTIKAEYDDKAFRVVVIEVHPFGIEEGEYMED